MSSPDQHDLDLAPSDPPATAGWKPDTPGPDNVAEVRPAPSSGGVLGWAVAAGLLAGVVAAVIGEREFARFIPPTHKATMMGLTYDTTDDRTVALTQGRNATVGAAILGGLLGLGLGLAGGRAGRSTNRHATLGAAVGLVGGAAAGAAASQALLPIYYHLLDIKQEQYAGDLLLPCLVQAGIASAMGAAGGLALGIGLGDRRRVLGAVAGGAVGGALGAVVFQLVGALAFPTSHTHEPLASEWMPRVLAVLVPALAIAIMAAALTATSATSSRRGRLAGGTVQPSPDAPSTGA
jgi:hypothetical protein